MNVAKDRLDAITKMIPSLTAPTVSPLYGTEWFAIESVISESVVRELIPRLLKSGAEGIIEYPLNKVI
jgi:ATP phosphoribosyltransferase